MLVKFTAAYSLVTYLLMLSLFILYWCSPISGYLAVPAKFSTGSGTAAEEAIVRLTRGMQRNAPRTITI